MAYLVQKNRDEMTLIEPSSLSAYSLTPGGENRFSYVLPKCFNGDYYLYMSDLETDRVEEIKTKCREKAKDTNMKFKSVELIANDRCIDPDSLYPPLSPLCKFESDK